MKQGDMKLQGIDPLDAIVVRLGRKRATCTTASLRPTSHDTWT